MAKVTIGGVQYTLEEMNFVAVKRCWPYIERSMVLQDPIEASSTAIHIVAAVLMEQEGFDPVAFKIPTELGLDDDQIHRHLTVFLQKALKASEMKNLPPCVDQILEEAGFEPDSGEPKAAAETEGENASTEIAPNTSSSLLPQE